MEPVRRKHRKIGVTTNKLKVEGTSVKIRLQKLISDENIWKQQNLKQVVGLNGT